MFENFSETFKNFNLLNNVIDLIDSEINVQLDLMFKVEVLKNNIEKEYYYETINQIFFKLDEKISNIPIEKPLPLLNSKRKRKLTHQYEEETEKLEAKPIKRKKY